MVRSKLLMCRPTHFGVRYVINPWMDLNDSPDPVKAQRQWENVVQALVSVGCEVNLVDAAEEQPDMVFAANSGWIYDHQAVVGRFRHQERQGETFLYTSWFLKNGYQLHTLPEGFCFEGEGDCMPYKDRLLMAHGFRTDREVHPLIGKLLHKEILSLELADPRFYHLDTCLLHLHWNDILLYFPQAFTPASQQAIQDLPSTQIAISEEDALSFACNAVAIGSHLVLNRCSLPLRHRLEALGIQVLTADTSEFLKAGGSVRCMVLHLN